MPKSRKRPRAAAKAATARRHREGAPSNARVLADGRRAGDRRDVLREVAAVSGHNGPDRQAQIEADRIWSVGAAGAAREDPEGLYEFAGPPWSVWLAARDAGESPEALAILGHQQFARRTRDLGEWRTEAMTLAELIAGAMPEAIVSTSAAVSLGEAIESLAGEGVLLWDQDSQTAIDGPRTIAENDAEDKAHFQKFGHY
jgi:hypothetical protein